MSSYESPKIIDLGTVDDLTRQAFNKVGNSVDQFGPVLEGSLIPSGG